MVLCVPYLMPKKLHIANQGIRGYSLDTFDFLKKAYQQRQLSETPAACSRSFPGLSVDIRRQSRPAVRRLPAQTTQPSAQRAVPFPDLNVQIFNAQALFIYRCTIWIVGIIDLFVSPLIKLPVRRRLTPDLDEDSNCSQCR